MRRKETRWFDHTCLPSLFLINMTYEEGRGDEARRDCEALSKVVGGLEKLLVAVLANPSEMIKAGDSTNGAKVPKAESVGSALLCSAPLLKSLRLAALMWAPPLSPELSHLQLYPRQSPNLLPSFENDVLRLCRPERH